MSRGLKALAMGGLAAAAGLAGGAAIAKLAPQSKMANVAANLAGSVIGGLVGAFDQTAGTIIAHNYAVAAGQWFLAPAGAVRAQSHAGGRGGMLAAPRVAMPVRMLPASAMHGIEDVDGVVVADNMGAADDVDGFERLEGVVVADNMGDAEDVGGFERLEGVVVADNMGAPDDFGLGDDAELGDEINGFDDPFGDLDD